MQFDRKRILELAGLTEDSSVDSVKQVNESFDPDTLVETKLRAIIRKEIAAILRDLKEKGEGTAWMYRTIGYPRNSRPGRVTCGFPGLGFK